MLVLGEMSRHPVNNDANARLVAAIDEKHQVLGRTVAGGGSVVAHYLIAPGAVKGMLGNRQQFDVGVAHFLHVGNQAIGQFAIGEEARTRLVGNGYRRATFGGIFDALVQPGAEMHFINGNGPVVGVGVGPLLQPIRILPGVGQVGDDGRGGGTQFLLVTVGIGL